MVVTWQNLVRAQVTPKVASRAGLLGFDESLTEACSLRLQDVPIKLGVWVEVIAQVHEDRADQMPVSPNGKRYTGLLQ